MVKIYFKMLLKCLLLGAVFLDGSESFAINKIVAAGTTWNVVADTTILDSLIVETGANVEVQPQVLLKINKSLVSNGGNLILSHNDSLHVQNDIILINSTINANADSNGVRAINIISYKSDIKIYGNNIFLRASNISLNDSSLLEISGMEVSINRTTKGNVLFNNSRLYISADFASVYAKYSSNELVLNSSSMEIAGNEASLLLSKLVSNNSTININGQSARLETSVDSFADSSNLNINGDFASFFCFKSNFTARNHSKIEINAVLSNSTNFNVSDTCFLNNSELILNGQNAISTIAHTYIDGSKIEISEIAANSYISTHYIVYSGTVANPPHLIIAAGELSADYICRNEDGNPDNDVIVYTQSNGRITFPDTVLGNKKADKFFPPLSRAIFDIGDSKSTTNWSGGLVRIDTSAGANQFAVYIASINNLGSGGTLLLQPSKKDQFYKVLVNNEIDSFILNKGIPAAANNPILEIIGTAKMNFFSLNSVGDNRLIFYDSIFIHENFDNSLEYNGINAIGENSYFVFDGVAEQRIINSTPNALPFQIKNMLIKNNNIVHSEKNIDITGELLLESGNLSIADKILIFDHGAKVYKKMNSSPNKISELSSFSISTSIIQSIYGKVQYKLQPNISQYIDDYFIFPITILGSDSTTTQYLGAYISFFGNAIYGAKPLLSVVPHNYVHENHANDESYLKSFWQVSADDIQIENKYFSINFCANPVEWQGDLANLLPTAKLDFQRELFPAEENKTDTVNNYLSINAKFVKKNDYLNGIWGLVTIGNLFYSRCSGNWNEKNTWTLAADHLGEAVPHSIIFPATPSKKDSVIISNNHIIDLNNDIIIEFLSVGTNSIIMDLENIGRLNMGEFIISGNKFILHDNSTIGIGSENGIAEEGVFSGNIQTDERIFSNHANYIYNNKIMQITGLGIPDTVASILFDNSDKIYLSKSHHVYDSIIVYKGDVFMNKNSLLGLETAKFEMKNNDTKLYLDGNLSILSACGGYDKYIFNIPQYCDSIKTTIIFDGSEEQFVSDLPDNFYSNNEYYFNSNDVFYPAPNAFNIGFPNVELQNGIKYITNNISIFGNLVNRYNSELIIHPDITTSFPILKIYKNLFNSSAISNHGTIEIGY